MKKSDIDRLIAILKTLNTNARILPISQGKVSVNEVLSTGLFNFERAQQAPGWLKEMQGEHVPELKNMESVASAIWLGAPSIQSGFLSFFMTLKNLEN